jgi:hypothetical protein
MYNAMMTSELVPSREVASTECSRASKEIAEAIIFGKHGPHDNADRVM